MVESGRGSSKTNEDEYVAISHLFKAAGSFILKYGEFGLKRSFNLILDIFSWIFFFFFIS